MLFLGADMNIDSIQDRPMSLGYAQRWLALGAGAALLLVGASRRSASGALLAASSAPLLYRGVAGHWPNLGNGVNTSGHTKTALEGPRGVHVRESIRLEVPLADVYRFWRRFENLPRFMTHLDRVSDRGDGKSHWVAAGPAGLAVEWDAEIINEIENQVIAWRSFPGSDITSAGSVRFDAVRAGRSTQVSVHLQYAPPAGKAGALFASLFGREPSQTIREDLRHFKQQLEAGEMPRAAVGA
jgi:uncharacterized membrane protein